MFRLFVALTLLFLNLEACEGGYDSCKQKIIDSNTIQNQTLQIPISKTQRLIFSQSVPKGKIIKSDPFLSLYLVEDTEGFKYPFRINMRQPSGVAGVNETFALEGKIVKKQIGLNSLAKFNEVLFAPALLLNSCCSLEGIVTPKGIIEKEYIERFLKVKDTAYSDIGIRVNDENGAVVVRAIDPFVLHNPFQKGDVILLFEGKKVQDSASLMREILFSSLGSKHTLKVKRGSKIMEIEVQSRKRHSGGYVSDTFLEQYGLWFDKNLNIIKIQKNEKLFGVLVGDRLLQVNGKKVKNQQDIIENISDFKENAYLLFERRNFQFFVRIN